MPSDIGARRRCTRREFLILGTSGVPAAEAARTFRIPEALGEWMTFSGRYFEVALRAWERELRGS
jgi:hypothetical protein